MPWIKCNRPTQSSLSQTSYNSDVPSPSSLVNREGKQRLMAIARTHLHPPRYCCARSVAAYHDVIQIVSSTRPTSFLLFPVGVHTVMSTNLRIRTIFATPAPPSLCSGGGDVRAPSGSYLNSLHPCARHSRIHTSPFHQRLMNTSQPFRCQDHIYHTHSWPSRS